MKKIEEIGKMVASTKRQISEEKYRHLIENMNLGLLEVDNDEKIIYANSSFCTMAGYEFDELLGKRASDLLLDQGNVMLMKEKNQERLDGTSSVYEMPIRTKDGQIVWMLISGGSLYDYDGNIIGSIGIHLDITNRKSIENQRLELLEKQEYIQSSLQESEGRLRAIIDSALDAVITIDPSGYITEWNQQAEKIFGFTNAEAVGKKLTETIIPEKYKDAHNNGMAHHAKTGEGPVLNKRIEISAVNKQGIEFPIELSIAPVKMKGQFFFSAFLRDITVEKESKLEMERALLKEKELSELKSRFVTMTSHEFRTPLTTIQTNVEILSYKLTNNHPEIKSDFDKNFFRIDSEIKRLTSLMNDVLILGRLESGKLDCQLVPTDLVEYCQQLIETSFTQKEIVQNVDFSFKGDAKKVLIDPNLFSHVITNLLSNAFKYGTDGRARLELEYDKREVKLLVIDKGIGIPQEEQEHLFDSFFRASNVHNIQGTGLGLSIVKQFVDMHEGTISVDSKEGNGTTFTVNLNLK